MIGKDSIRTSIIQYMSTRFPEIHISRFSPLFVLLIEPLTEFIYDLMQPSLDVEVLLSRVLSGEQEYSSNEIEILSSLYQIRKTAGSPAYSVALLEFNESAKTYAVEDPSKITMDLDADTFYVTVNGRRYYPLSAYRITPSIILGGSVTIPIISSGVGERFNQTPGVTGLVGGPIAPYVQSTKLPSGAVRGTDRESDDSFYRRIQNLTNMVSHFSKDYYEYTIRKEFPAIRDITIISSHDTGMLRDTFEYGDTSLNVGGRVDVYVSPGDVLEAEAVLSSSNILELSSWPALVNSRSPIVHRGAFSLGSQLVYDDMPGGEGTFLTTLNNRGDYLPESANIIDLTELNRVVISVESVETLGGLTLIPGTDYLFMQADRTTAFSTENKPFIILREDFDDFYRVKYRTSSLIKEMNNLFGTGPYRTIGVDLLIKHHPPLFLQNIEVNYYSKYVVSSDKVFSDVANTAKFETVHPIIEAIYKNGAEQVHYPMKLTLKAVADTGKEFTSILYDTISPQHSIQGLPGKDLFRLVLPQGALELVREEN